MLEHDELLSAEQANPALVQKLQAAYRMHPEEKQVLARVHLRLAHHADRPPQLEPMPAGGNEWAREPGAVLSPPIKPASSGSRWHNKLNTLVAVLAVCLLVGALALTFSAIGHTRIGSGPHGIGSANDMRVVLVPAKGGTPSHAAMEAARTLLAERFASFGLSGAMVRVIAVDDQPAVQVQLPSFGDEQQTLAILLETGTLAFWSTGNQVITGTSFDPAQFILENPGGKPRFTNRDIKTSVLAVNVAQRTGAIGLNFMMNGGALQRFRLYTASNIGQALTITLEGKVLCSAIINSSVSGPFIVETNLTLQQAKALVSVLKHGPLPVELKQLT